MGAGETGSTETPRGVTLEVSHPAAFGDAIRTLRHSLGLSQAELAARTGIRRTYLSQIEGGKVTEQLEAIVNLLKAMGAGITVRREAH